MKIALGVEYDGSQFHGWQGQDGLSTVQGALETALSFIAHEPIKIFCAGRTDAGVHAHEQVVHFETTVHRDPKAWTIGVNTHLPKSISIKWFKIMPVDFHARFSAIARRYRYIIYNHPFRSALLTSRVTWIYRPLDIIPMQTAASYLLGEHDFSSFRSSRCESHSPIRHMHEISIIKTSHFIIIEVQANAFLHHMVRNIVGVLLQIGRGRQPQESMHEILLAKDRKVAAETAPAAGLYLKKVFYPPHFSLPESNQTHFIL